MNVWLIRHAETEWSRDGRHTGRTDVPLTDEGRRYAAGPLREALAGQELVLVLCSPLVRARETCELAGLGDRMQVRDDLLEWDYGEYEGITTADIRRTRPDWFLWRDGAPGGETAGQVGARADRVVAEALAAGGDVALFSHGHVLRVIGARWIEQPAEHGGRLALSTGALCRLGCEREVRVIWTWNLRAAPPAGA